MATFVRQDFSHDIQIRISWRAAQFIFQRLYGSGRLPA